VGSARPLVEPMEPHITAIRPGSHKSRPLPLILLAAGLAAVSGAVTLVATASRTAVVVAVSDLRRYSTSTYDILVRPAGARTSIEETYDLVEGNHLSAIWGGITFEEYDAIKGIPGVQVAAPIAMIGYFEGSANGREIPLPSEPGIYRLDETVEVGNEPVPQVPPEFPRRTYFVQPSDPNSDNRDAQGLVVNHSGHHVRPWVSFPFLLAGIDPDQERALVGLHQAIVEGNYLAADEPLEPFEYEPAPGFNNVFFSSKPMFGSSILINSNSYIRISHRAELRHVVLPAGVTSLQEILALGGPGYLDTLPAQIMGEAGTGGEELHQEMINTLQRGDVMFGTLGAVDTPGPVSYAKAEPVQGFDGLALDLVLPGNSGAPYWTQFRAPATSELNAFFAWDVKGVIDIERIPRPPELVGLPMETYFPPVALLRFDERGDRIEPPRDLGPTLNPAGYIQPPPLMLTTTRVARALRGEDAISAIRVRVAGVDELTPAAQRKIEAVASAIFQRTGLTVDIVTGSSPTRVLVHVPGVGYIQELWIQKGANLVYQERIQTGHWVVLAVLLGVGGLYTFDLAWADLLRRQRVIALQKALGWRSRTVFRLVLRQLVLIGAGSGVIGTAVGAGLAWSGGWEVQPDILALVPLCVIVVCASGGLYPAWRAARTPPVLGLQLSGLRHKPRPSARYAKGLWGYAIRGLARRVGRSLSAAIIGALSAGLLVVIGAILQERQGTLSGTLLGEFVLVQLGPMHLAIVVAALLLAALSTGNALVAGAVERRRVLGAMQALGWRARDVASLFIREGLLMGLAAGMVGALIGSAVYHSMYRLQSPAVGSIAVGSVVVVALVGALSGIYAGLVASKSVAADILRYE